MRLALAPSLLQCSLHDTQAHAPAGMQFREQVQVHDGERRPEGLVEGSNYVTPFSTLHIFHSGTTSDADTFSATAFALPPCALDREHVHRAVTSHD